MTGNATTSLQQRIIIGTASEASPDWLRDPEVFAVNRMPAHSDHRCYDHTPACGESSNLTASLDGRWRVNVVEAAEDGKADGSAGFSVTAAPDTACPDFARPDFDDSGFGTIAVPSHLETAGYLPPKYVNVQYPWDGHDDPCAPDVPRRNHVALYRRTFAASGPIRSAIRDGRRVTLVFHGAQTAIYVWLNGMFIGYGEDSFTPSEFDVTDAVIDGDNVLAVACYEYASASWLEDQDYWRLHGLFRSVELTAWPAAHIGDMRIVADFDHRRGEGLLDIRTELHGAVPGTARTVTAQLIDADGDVVWRSPHDVGPVRDDGAAADGDDGMADAAMLSWNTAVECAHPWSAEDPYLYTLRLTVTDAEGSVVEVAEQRIGFRRFAIEDGIMKINGKRIVFKGVDRHEFDARRGRAVTEEDMLWDVRFLKRHNLNAVRTSHYPNQSRWYELCDEYGIYLIDETNLETHGTWSAPGDGVTPETNVPGNDARWEGACLDRVDSMIRRDFNHPSVVIWSLGNESYAGTVIQAMHDLVHELDAMRPVHYEGVFWNRKFDAASDIESRMYAKPAEIEEYLTNDPKKPYISCEYMHAMGNSVGGMQLYTALERYPRYQGGFIWDYIDQALWQRLGDGSERLTYGGDWDDRPHDYEFAGDGIVFADRTISPKAQEVKQLYANVRITPDATGVTIANGNLFVPTGGYVFTARLLVDGVERWKADYRFEVPAGETRRFDVAFPDAGDFARVDGGTVEVTYEVDQRLAKATPWAEAGYELAFGQHTIAVESKADGGDDGNGGTRPNAIEVVDGRWNLGIHSVAGDSGMAGRGTGTTGDDDFEVLLSRTQGGMVSLRRGRREMVIRRPQIVTFRPLTDNDRGNGSGFERAQWFGAGRYARVADTRFDAAPDRITAEYVYELAEPRHTRVTVRYEVDGAGTVHLTASYPGAADAPTLPAFGLEWMLPAQYTNLRFYGPGPEETYPDRKLGGRLGIHETTAADSVAQYLVPQETGNHEDVRWAEVTDEHGHGMRVSQAGADRFSASLLPYSSLMLEEATHQNELPQPRHTFLRLLAAQMGVGGDDSWGAPVHRRYLLDAAKPLTLDVHIELI
ncbi:glycoside hydrolase family 2 TIM barrel-domain containing protein [Bifidobacterium catulorum]|uniref:Beta-galactosidase n=1 Tax=Bifidobacterium catulorum TaxID=1630173 RepID=A0A2U2MRW2_9BIFI|nr:glycoside hydrolase family 2 TIM barrel-domain containing protein [Bifidobacterium catulorum]PWG59569.1 beta-galactosidase [Bifidobacterium catulorum]